MKERSQLIKAAIVFWMAGQCMVFGQPAPTPFPPEPNNSTPFPPPMASSGAPYQPGEATAITPSPEMEPDPTRKRDPFWPVNYTPKKPTIIPTGNTQQTAGNTVRVDTEKAKSQDWDSARKLLDIRGISLIRRDKQSNAPKYIAIVGGKLVEAGDTVSSLFDEQIYRWKVASISDNGISLVKLDVRRE